MSLIILLEKLGIQGNEIADVLAKRGKYQQETIKKSF